MDTNTANTNPADRPATEAHRAHGASEAETARWAEEACWGCGRPHGQHTEGDLEACIG